MEHGGFEDGLDSTIGATAEAGNSDSGRMLVPFVPCLSRTRYSDQLSRPDPGFVTQLMAMEQQFPQTRVLRRARPDEATAAYRLVARGNAAACHTRRTT